MYCKTKCYPLILPLNRTKIIPKARRVTTATATPTPAKIARILEEEKNIYGSLNDCIMRYSEIVVRMVKVLRIQEKTILSH